jgi:hypothetical protein
MGSGTPGGIVTGPIDGRGRALVRIRCMLSESEAKHKAQFGMQLPNPEIASGLIDTGCTGFALGARLIAKLGLTFTDKSPSKNAGGRTETRFFNASLSLLSNSDETVLVLPNVRVSELPAEFAQFEALIGWEALQHGELEFSGPGRRFALRV